MTAALVLLPSVQPTVAVRGSQRLSLQMRHSGRQEVELRYQLHGRAGAPVILVGGGISAHRQLAANDGWSEPGWAQSLVGPGMALDPQRWQLLSLDWLGADGRLDVAIDTADQAAAIAALLPRLGIASLAAVVGYSYGALVGLQLAAGYPGLVQRLVAVSGAHRPHPYASAWRALQRRAVALGQLQCGDAHGLALARQFAMLSYRTPEEFDQRFGAAPELVNGRVRVPAEDYLDAVAARFVSRMPATAFVRLSESIDLHRVDPSRVPVPTTVVAVEGDRLVPLADMVALVEGLAGPATLRVLRSPYGHDAFLKESARIDALLLTALRPTGETA